MVLKRNILITGATGNLGCQILKQILLSDRKRNKYKIFLIVRAANKIEANIRVENLIKFLFKKEVKEISSKIKIFLGDISEDRFGLDGKDYNFLIQKVDIIYHSAALTRFQDPISKLRFVNVGGTKRILSLISESKRKIDLHYISTAFIAGNFRGNFNENDFDRGQEFNNPYEQSKFEAESLVRRFQKDNTQVCIYRPSIIIGEYKTGAILNFQMFYKPLYLFSKEVFSEIPINKSASLNLIPVDIAARMILILANAQKSTKENIYHIVSPKSFTITQVINLSAKYFNFKKPKILNRRHLNANLKFSENISVKSILNYFNFEANLESQQTLKKLNDFGFRFPVLNSKFFNKIFLYAHKMKYINKKNS